MLLNHSLLRECVYRNRSQFGPLVQLSSCRASVLGWSDSPADGMVTFRKIAPIKVIFFWCDLLVWVPLKHLITPSVFRFVSQNINTFFFWRREISKFQEYEK